MRVRAMASSPVAEGLPLKVAQFPGRTWAKGLIGKDLAMRLFCARVLVGLWLPQRLHAAGYGRASAACLPVEKSQLLELAQERRTGATLGQPRR